MTPFCQSNLRNGVEQQTPRFQLSQEEKEALLWAFPKGLIAIDLETTGLSPLVDKIIEMSLIKLDQDGHLSVFSSLIDPVIEIPHENSLIHGITNKMTDGAPQIKQVLEEYLRFSEGLDLLAHNAKFDLGFLIFQLQQNKLPYGHNQVFCSCQYARKIFKEVENHKLKTLTEYIGHQLENHHRADDDAFASLKVTARALILSRQSERPLKPERLFNSQDFNPKNTIDIPAHLEELKKKVRFGHVVQIKYRGGTVKNQWRPVKLVSLLPLPHGNVLYAKCLESQMYKSFLLSRITDWKPATEEELQKWLKKSD